MIEQFVGALPVDLLPYVKTILFIPIGLMAAMAAVTALLFNRFIIAVVCVAIATGLWIVTPEISDRAEIRQLMLERVKTAAKGATLTERLHVTFIGKGYVNIELDGAEKSMLVGESYKGVKLLKVEEAAALFEIDGKQVAKGSQ